MSKWLDAKNSTNCPLYFQNKIASIAIQNLTSKQSKEQKSLRSEVHFCWQIDLKNVIDLLRNLTFSLDFIEK